MKKLCITFLINFLFITCIPISIEAAATINKTIALPTETLSGGANSQKTYYLDLPNGIPTSSINTSSLKYNGTNQIVSLSIDNGKIKVTLTGVEAKQRIDNLLGYQASWQTLFSTRPGNSIWRYSDGIRWQVNEWNPDTNSQKHSDINGQGSGIPRNDPPDMKVVTQSPVSRDYIKWYNKSVNDIIAPADIIESSVQIIVPTELLSTTYISHNILNKNQFIIYYKMDAAKINYDPEELPQDWKGGWATGRRYKITLNYYYTASANVTSYKYSGNVSFDYNLPNEPTLTGSATLNTPSPNPAKLGDKDQPVQFTLKGDLLGYTDASNIQEWVFYAQKRNQPATLITKKETAKSLTASKSFDYTIKKTEVSGEAFTQDYDLRVRVRFKTSIMTKNGPIDSLEQPLNLSAGVYKTTQPVEYPAPPPGPSAPEGMPPIARISTSRYVKAGDDLFITGRGSSDPDGTIEGYWWDTPGAQGSMGNESTGTVWYTNEQVDQTFPIALSIIDNDGLTGSTSAEVTVIKPEPTAS